jgi:hypothetical protein
MKAKDWRPTSFVETAPGEIGEDQAEAARVERRRALYGFLRHLMALDAAALVLVATLIEKVFAQPLQRSLIGVSVAASFISLLFGGVAYVVLLAEGPRKGAQRASSSEPRIAILTSLFTLLGLLVAIGALGWFFLVNWFR